MGCAYWNLQRQAKTTQKHLMPIPFPKLVKVGPHTYDVRLMSSKDMLKLRGGDLGMCDHNETLIAVRKRSTLTKTQETLLHEVLHACCYPQTLDEKQEEQFVEAVTTNLLQVIKDNADLLDYLRRLK